MSLPTESQIFDSDTFTKRKPLYDFDATNRIINRCENRFFLGLLVAFSVSIAMWIILLSGI